MVERGEVGRLNAEECVFFCCDIQRVLTPHLWRKDALIAAARFLMQGAHLLKVLTVVTEQYPKGLGSTVAELSKEAFPDAHYVPKTLFTMYVPEVQEIIPKQTTAVVIFGAETQVCIQQTVMDLLASGYAVHVVIDATTSRSPLERKVAFQRMAAVGAYLTTAESVLFELLKGKDHSSFKEVSTLVKSREVPESALDL